MGCWLKSRNREARTGHRLQNRGISKKILRSGLRRLRRVQYEDPLVLGRGAANAYNEQGATGASLSIAQQIPACSFPLTTDEAVREYDLLARTLSHAG